MKKTILLSGIALLAKISVAQTVSPDSAKYYEGKTITVCGKIVDTHVSGGEKKNTKLNFEKAYPETPFTAVIFEADLPNFKYTPSEYLKSKNVCVTGAVKMYKDKPEIVITSEKELKIK
jgi:hypothetical protein